jgi:hypothetical protein
MKFIGFLILWTGSVIGYAMMDAGRPPDQDGKESRSRLAVPIMKGMKIVILIKTVWHIGHDDSRLGE